MQSHMVALLLDFRSSYRQMRKNFKIAVVSILTISCSIGIIVAAFSVFEAELIRSLPYYHPEEIVILQGRSANGQPMLESYLHYLDVQRETKAFSAIGGFTTSLVNVEVGGEVKRLNAVYVTDGFLDVFGVKPVLGRTFVKGENNPGRTDVAVISFEVWQQQFGGATTAIGQVVKIDDKSRTVIGVMPREFRYPLGARNATYIPLSINIKTQVRGSHWLRTVARLNPGFTQREAQADLNRMCQEFSEVYPVTDAGYKINAVNLETWTARDTQAPLRALLAAAFAVFLIGCFNTASLIIFRNVKRKRELSLRIALGASRQEIIRLVLVDSLLLSAFGLGGGLLIAWLFLNVMRPFLLNSLSRGAEISLDLPTLVMALTAALGTSLLVGVIPAVRLSKINPNSVLKEQMDTGGERSHHRIRASIVIIQTALAFSLLVIAGGFVRQVLRWRNTDLGFSAANVLTMEINVAPTAYQSRDIVTDFYQPLLDNVTAIPGVSYAGVIQVLPIQDWGWSSAVHIAGTPHDPPSNQKMAEDRYVSPGYYRALGIPLVKGRMFDAKLDTKTSQTVCLVNEAFVQVIFANRDPLGQKIDEGGGPPCVIIGVMKSIRQDLFQEPLPEEDYLISQFPTDLASRGFATMHLVVRSNRGASDLAADLHKSLHESYSSVPFEAPETIDAVLGKVIVLQRMEGWLFGGFAILAIFLAAVGLYGLISYEIQVSVRAIGLRMALGATRWSILHRVLRRVFALVLSGIMIGGATIFFFQRLYAGLFIVNISQDIAPITELAVGLFLIGMTSALLPALRAASIQPMDALRDVST
jgi:putative ABC transport system permease protein